MITEEKTIELSKETGLYAVLIENKYYALRNKYQLLDMVENGIDFIVINMGDK